MYTPLNKSIPWTKYVEEYNPPIELISGVSRKDLSALKLHSFNTRRETYDMGDHFISFIDDLNGYATTLESYPDVLMSNCIVELPNFIAAEYLPLSTGNNDVRLLTHLLVHPIFCDMRAVLNTRARITRIFKQRSGLPESLCTHPKYTHYIQDLLTADKDSDFPGIWTAEYHSLPRDSMFSHPDLYTLAAQALIYTQQKVVGVGDAYKRAYNVTLFDQRINLDLFAEDFISPEYYLPFVRIAEKTHFVWAMSAVLTWGRDERFLRLSEFLYLHCDKPLPPSHYGFDGGSYPYIIDPVPEK